MRTNKTTFALRTVCFIVAFFTISSAISCNSFAYNHGNGLSVRADVTNLPKDVAYIDLFVLTKDKPKAIVNSELIGIAGNIVTLEGNELYNKTKDGWFISYSAYVSNDIMFSNENDGKIRIDCGAMEQNIRNTYEKVMMVYLDDEGNIINHSNAVSLKEFGPIALDALRLSGTDLKAEYTILWFYPALLFSVICVVVTIVLIIKNIRGLSRNHKKI